MSSLLYLVFCSKPHSLSSVFVSLNLSLSFFCRLFAREDGQRVVHISGLRDVRVDSVSSLLEVCLIFFTISCIIKKICDILVFLAYDPSQVTGYFSV